MDPTPPVRPILKTATKTGSRTRFLADSTSKYKSYSQSFHYTSYSSASSRSSRSSRASTVSSTGSSSTGSSSGGSSSGSSMSASSSSFSGSSMSIMSSLSSSVELSASASASTTASSRERKRSDEIFLTPGDRRVTFSPFTKIPRKPKSKKALAESRKMTSGFVFSTGGEAEKRKQAKKKQELQLMEKLYLASRRRSLGWKDMLLEHCTVLKDVHEWTKRWVDTISASPIVALVRKTLKKQRHRRLGRSSHPRRQRLSLSPAWSEFDQADHEYMKRLTSQQQQQQQQQHTSESAGATTSHSVVVHHQSRSNLDHPQHYFQSATPAPDLTPMKQGSFTSLLRREGIPVDEDEQREKIALVADLRGVGHSSIRLKVSRY